MRHDGATIGSAGSMVRGFSPAWTIPAELLAAVRTPTHFVWGGADTFGGPDVGHATVDAMPAATLEVWADAGHLPWLDDPDRAAAVVSAALQP